MKASDLRDRLNELISRRGDLPVVLIDRTHRVSTEITMAGNCFSSLLQREAICVVIDQIEEK